MSMIGRNALQKRREKTIQEQTMRGFADLLAQTLDGVEERVARIEERLTQMEEKLACR